MFLHCTNLYPVALIKYGGTIIPWMENTKYSNEIETVTKDWVRFFVNPAWENV